MADTPTGIDGLSPSSIDLWHQCPRKFHAEKYEGHTGGTSEAALLGTYIHLILEHLMEQPAHLRTAATARHITTEAWRTFSTSPDWTTWTTDTHGTDPQAFRRQAWTSVCTYLETEDVTAIDVLATERFLRGTLNGVPVRGIVDRLDRSPDGTITVSDYKSGKVPAPQFRGSKLRQLNLYAALVHHNDGQQPTHGRLLFTTYGKIITTAITDDTIADATHTAQRVWNDVGEAEATGEWPTHVGPLCGWCPFVADCPTGLAHVRERHAEGKLKRSAPAYTIVAEGTHGEA
jgi:putative RecB family exonuclease